MGSIKLRQIGGFENNKWRVDYRFRKRGDVQQYEHKTIGIIINIMMKGNNRLRMKKNFAA